MIETKFTEPTKGMCTEGRKCNYGGEHSSPHAHSGYANLCDGKGRKCSHGLWKDHDVYTSVTLEWQASEAGTIDIQDAAVCSFAKREYKGVDFEGTLDIDLTTMIAGNVWVDLLPQKTNSFTNGIRDDLEKEQKNSLGEIVNEGTGQQHIAVTVYIYKETTKLKEAIMHDADGNAIDWPIYTEADGYWHVDRIEAPATNTDTQCFYVVEFQYDGQVLRHTVFLADSSGDETTVDTYNFMPNSYASSSMAVEDQDERYLFDQKFGVITGDKPIDDDTGNTEGQIFRTDEAGQGKDDEKAINYTSDLKGTDPKKLVTSKLDSAATEERGNIPKEVTPGYGYELYKMSAKTFYDDTPLHGTAPNPQAYRIEYPIKKAGERKWTLCTGTKRYIDEYMLHINLGLQRRSETDMSVLKDLYKVTMVVNEQKLTKQFNYLKDIDPQYTEAFEQLYEKKKATDGRERYSLGLYPSDLSYQAYHRYHNAIEAVYNIKKNSEIRVYASYVVRIYNNSATNAVELNELTDYFDPTYTLVQEDVYNLEDNDKYLWVDLPEGQTELQNKYGRQEVKTPIVDEKLHRNMEVIADAPYYRVMNTADGLRNCIWKETKEKNLEGIADTGYFNWTETEDLNNTKVIKTDSFTEKKLTANQYLELFTTYEIDKAVYDEAGNLVGGYDYVRNLQERNPSAEELIKHREGLVKALSEAQDKENIAEISSYSTYYGGKDVESLNAYYAPYTGYTQENGYGWVSGKVDKDSAPNNIPRDTLENLKDRDKYEDDTDRSVPIRISLLEKEIERTMNGTVWEDEKGSTPETTVGATYGIKTGNGFLDDNEKGIGNVEVSLYEVINLGTLTKNEENNTYDYNSKFDSYDYYFKVPNEFYTEDGNAVITKLDGTYQLKGFLSGDYIVRFDYGKYKDAEYNLKTRQEVEIKYNEDGSVNQEGFNIYKYNGQDYENTKFMASQQASKTLNKKYLDITERNDVHLFDYNKDDDIEVKKMSVVRDNESRRLVVNSYSRTIENDRAEILRNRNTEEFKNATQMFAETPIMQIEIRDPKIIEEEEKADGEFEEKYEDVIRTIDLSYEINGINCGLEKRAETDIELEKFVDTITLYKEETPILIAKMQEDGIIDVTNEKSMNLKQITYLSHSESRNAGANAEGTYNQGFYAIDVEAGYLNDLNLDIRYKLKTTNKSEVDFTGEIADYTVASEIIKIANQTADNYLGQIIDAVTGIGTTTTPVGVASNNTLADIESAESTDLARLISATDIDNLQKSAEADIPPTIDTTNISATDTIRPQTIVYGKYVGRFYYENKIDEYSSRNRYELNDYAGTDLETHLETILINYEPDRVVKTIVDQLVDYIDIDARFNEESQSVNEYWDKATYGSEEGFIKSLNGLITKETLYDESEQEILTQKGAYREVKGRRDIYDNKDRKYITETSSNIMLSKNEHIQKLTKYRDRERNSDYKTYLDDDYSTTGRVEYKNEDTLSIYNSRQTIQLVPEKYYDELYASE